MPDHRDVRETIAAEIAATTLERAAAHLEAARMHDWTGSSRKINGWASAARELRRLATAYRDTGHFDERQ